MKRLLFLTLPALVWAESYEQILRYLDDSLVMKSARQMKQAVYEMAKSAEGKNLPTLDADFTAVRLKETPTATFHLGAAPTKAPMGKKNNFEGALTLKYPIFTGFAITASIDKATWQHKQATLKVSDLKRNLYLSATQLSSAIDATDHKLDALKKAKDATDAALEKAQGLYDNGLLPPADLYNIRAKSYEIEAQITDAASQKSQLLNTLSQMTGHIIESVDLYGDSMPLDKETLEKEALSKREDIRALQAALRVKEEDIRLAKSRYYPTIGAAAALKRRGDTLKLNGDGIMNADESYLGASLSWNLFNGFSDKHTIEAARLQKLSSATSLLDYKNRVKRELDNAFLQLGSLKSRLLSAKMEVKAKEEYYKLTEGRFENQLASADELSRSIADLAASRAKVSALKSQIFNQKASIWLMSGLESFKNGFSMIRH
ncbi:TolC family protein [Hydrogenimonas sp.]